MQPETHFFAADDDVPNNPHLPLLIYRDAAHSSDMALFFEEIFERHGWGGIWRDGIFASTPFHSKSHEALGIAGGHARVQLGGDHGGAFDVKAGDLVVLPSGTGHKLLSSSHDFLVIGAYPRGQEDYDILSSMRDDPGAVGRIAQVPLPLRDPLTGTSAPLLDLWTSV